MNDEKRILKQVEGIKQITEPLKAISELADLTYSIGLDACEERVEIRGDVAKLQTVMVGNGAPDKSLISKIDRVQSCYDSIAEDIREIKILLMGDMKDASTKGMKGRLIDAEKQAKKTAANLDKLMWVVMFAVVAQILASIFL